MPNAQKQANDGRFNLTDLIVLPMQRILKYHLLLKEIVKQTPETHPDYGSIVKSYKIMIDLGEYLNEAKRDSEMLDTINAIQNSITDLIMPENTVLYDYGNTPRAGARGVSEDGLDVLAGTSGHPRTA